MDDDELTGVLKSFKDIDKLPNAIKGSRADTGYLSSKGLKQMAGLSAKSNIQRNYFGATLARPVKNGLVEALATVSNRNLTANSMVNAWSKATRYSSDNMQGLAAGILRTPSMKSSFAKGIVGNVPKSVWKKSLVGGVMGNGIPSVVLRQSRFMAKSSVGFIGSKMKRSVNQPYFAELKGISAKDWQPGFQSFNKATISANNVISQIRKAQENIYDGYVFGSSTKLANSLIRINEIQSEKINSFMTDTADISELTLRILEEYDNTPSMNSDVANDDLSSLSNDDRDINVYIQKLNEIAKDPGNVLASVAKVLLHLIRDALMVGLIVTPVLSSTIEKGQELEYYTALNAGWIAPTAYIDVTKAPIRTGHSIHAKIKMLLQVKTKLKVIKQVGKWSKVKISFGYNDEFGWIQTRYLNIND